MSVERIEELHLQVLPGCGDNSASHDLAQVDLEEYVAKADRMVALGEMVAGVAHNFGNVLMSLSATLEVLDIESSKDPRYARWAPMIAGALERVNSGAELTQHLMEFARYAPPVIGSVNPRTLTDKAVALCSAHLQAKRVHMLNDIPRDMRLIKGDANELEEVLTNLLLNALQASTDGRIRITAANVSPGEIELSVSDEGCGIAPEDLHMIFEPFFSKRRDGSAGTGLGLPRCLWQVNRMGGSMEVDSVLGKGSTFKVKLPSWEE